LYTQQMLVNFPNAGRCYQNSPFYDPSSIIMANFPLHVMLHTYSHII